MSLLGKFRRNPQLADYDWLNTDAVRWEPVHYAVARPLRGPAADMDDAGQVGSTVFETIFTSADVPGAEIAICAYPSFLESDGTYWKGLRYTYTTQAAPDWLYTGWEHDPHDHAYGSYTEADEAARHLASTIGIIPAWARAMLPGIFDWDGQPFDTSIHAAGEGS